MFPKTKSKAKRTIAGFTIIELMVALTVLTLLSLGAARVYLNYTGTARDLKAANLVYEEARYLMERLVREVRQNGIDYEEYFNQNVLGGVLSGNYCLYDQDFYSVGFDGQIGTRDDESLGLRNPDNGNTAPLAGQLEQDLYLINISGNRRTYLTRYDREVDGEIIGKIGMLKLVGEDYGADGINAADPMGDGAPDLNCTPDAGENDGLVDSWRCANDFNCASQELINGLCTGVGDLIVNDPLDANHSFADISPNALNVVDLQFIITPEDDPWKAYKVNDVQIQPHITIKLTVQANPLLVATTNKERIPGITLTSTVTTRNYDEIKSSCGKQ